MYGCEGYGVGVGSFKILCSMRSFICVEGDGVEGKIDKDVEGIAFGIGR
jgi:hypothetical protein